MDCPTKMKEGTCALESQFKSLRTKSENAQRKADMTEKHLLGVVDLLHLKLKDKEDRIEALRKDLSAVEEDALEFLRGLEAYQRGYDSASAFRSSAGGRRLQMGGTRTQERNPSPLVPIVTALAVLCPTCKEAMQTEWGEETFPPTYEGSLSCPYCHTFSSFPADFGDASQPRTVEIPPTVPGEAPRSLSSTGRRLQMIG